MIVRAECQGYCRQDEQVNMAVISSLDGRSRSKPELYVERYKDGTYLIKVPHGRGLGVAQGLKQIVVTSDLVMTCCKELYDALVEVRYREESIKSLDHVKVIWNMIGKEESREVTRTLMQAHKDEGWDFIILESMRELCEMVVKTSVI